MAHDPQVKAQLKRLYVFDRCSLEQAAEKLKVSLPTARRWKREAEKMGDDWDKARDVQVMAGGELEDVAKGILAGFLIQYKTVMTELEGNTEISAVDKVQALTGLADSFSKMTASSKKLLPSIDELATAIRAVKLVFDVATERKPHLQADFLELLELLEPLLTTHFQSKGSK